MPPADSRGGGGTMTMTLWTPGSSSSSRSASTYCPAVAAASMSTGLRVPASGGRMARSATSVSGRSAASRRPWLSSASAAVTPGPPALVSTATSRPAGSGHQASARAQSNSSSLVLARMTPARRKAALKADSCPASAPVWLATARCPAAKRPTFRAMTGLWRVAVRAAWTKRRPSLMPSR